MGAFELVRPSARCTPHVHSHARTPRGSCAACCGLSRPHAPAGGTTTRTQPRGGGRYALTRTRGAWCIRSCTRHLRRAAANGVADWREAAVGPSGARDGAQRTLQELARHTHTHTRCLAARSCGTHASPSRTHASSFVRCALALLLRCAGRTRRGLARWARSTPARNAWWRRRVALLSVLRVLRLL
jgi:hypothetical protein